MATTKKAGTKKPGNKKSSKNGGGSETVTARFLSAKNTDTGQEVVERVVGSIEFLVTKTEAGKYRCWITTGDGSVGKSSKEFDSMLDATIELHKEMERMGNDASKLFSQSNPLMQILEAIDAAVSAVQEKKQEAEKTA